MATENAQIGAFEDFLGLSDTQAYAIKLMLKYANVERIMADAAKNPDGHSSRFLTGLQTAFKDQTTLSLSTKIKAAMENAGLDKYGATWQEQLAALVTPGRIEEMNLVFAEADAKVAAEAAAAATAAAAVGDVATAEAAAAVAEAAAKQQLNEEDMLYSRLGDAVGIDWGNAKEKKSVSELYYALEKEGVKDLLNSDDIRAFRVLNALRHDYATRESGKRGADASSRLKRAFDTAGIKRWWNGSWMDNLRGEVFGTKRTVDPAVEWFKSRTDPSPLFKSLTSDIKAHPSSHHSERHHAEHLVKQFGLNNLQRLFSYATRHPSSTAARVVDEWRKEASSGPIYSDNTAPNWFATAMTRLYPSVGDNQKKAQEQLEFLVANGFE